MKRTPILVFALTGLLLLSFSASAFVITEKTDEQKHRRDISKQLGKYVFCLGKAALKCEKKGTTADVECNLADGSTPVGYDAKAAAKFTADIAKCDAKFSPQKKQKTSTYQAIGCPGDCDFGADGIQQCSGLGTYEASVESGSNPNGAKVQIGALGAIISANCQAFTGLPAGSAATIDCAANDAKRLNKAGKGINKCTELCENDYKSPDKKGGGGPNDDPVCNAGDPGAALNYNICLTKKRDKQLAKVEAPGNASVVASLIDAALNQAANDLYNKNDPATPDPDINVCGTCGDNTREGSEDCDGTDDSACPGSCNSDCTCP